MMQNSGFLEIEHTADWAIKVWAPDLEELLIVAAEAMYSLSNTVKEKAGVTQVTFELKYFDPESLLVDFLSELLFIGETKNLAAESYKINFIHDLVIVEIFTAKITKRKKEIKAVTYYDLEIVQTDHGLQTMLVFDV